MTRLADFMAADLARQDLPPGVERLAEAIITRHGAAVRAIVLYGSCRRKTDASEGLVDLLVLVSSYRQVHGFGPTALLNRLLPPNVYYLETDDGDPRLRCKYAIVSERHFSRLCRQPGDRYFWARFSQPARLIVDHGVGDRVAVARAEAAVTFARACQPLISEVADAETFWTHAIRTSYGCELRPESPAAARTLVEHDPEYWRALTAVLVSSKILPGDDAGRVQPGAGRFGRVLTRLGWARRRVGGKITNLGRLFKAAGTFTNGIDYLLWKVERHSGVRVEPTDRMRRHPRLAAWGLAWRLWRQGAFR